MRVVHVAVCSFHHVSSHYPVPLTGVCVPGVGSRTPGPGAVKLYAAYATVEPTIKPVM